MDKNVKDIDVYISSFPDSTQKILNKIKNLILEIVPEAEEAFSYQMPTFKLNKKNMIHFAAWNSHIGIYPTPSGISAFEPELKEYEHAKGSVKFPLDKPIPYDLIQKLVDYRAREIKK